MTKIRIEYDGVYPCLCMGHLKVYIDDTLWDFGKHCLSSGGAVIGGPPDWDFEVTRDSWSISDWPKGFPEHMKDVVLDAVNNEIPWGCCGGCI